MRTEITTQRHCIHALILPGLLALGCSAAQGGGALNPEMTGASEFPTRAQLADLGASPKPSRVNVGNDVNVATWKLVGPLPDAIDDAPEDGSTPWSQAALNAAAKRPRAVMATKAMGCAARASASFLLEHKALPGRAVSRFIAGRCGVPTAYLHASSVTVKNVPAGKSDEEVWGALQGDVAKMTQEIGPGLSWVGVGFARSEDRAGAIVVTAARSARVDRTPLLVTEGTVVLRGEVQKPVATLEALVTAGNYGFEECTQDINVELPRFAIQCPIAKADAAVTIQVVGFPAGRLLGNTVLETVLFPTEPSTAFTGSTAPDAAIEGDKRAVATALAERINAVRKDAGMGPLGLSPAESAVADTLAPYYFAATNGEMDPLIADKVVLGLMAGWDVGGEVREGHFSSAIYGHRDPSRLLDELAARPFGRQTLFDPKASVLAVGALAPDDGALATVIGTYSLLEGAASADAEMGQVIDRITRLRRAKGLPPPRLVRELDVDARWAAEKVRRGTDPRKAMNTMIEDSAGRLSSGGIKGWAITAPTVETLQMPSELLSWSNLPIALSVVHYRPPGHPWVQLLVFVVAARLDGPRTARAEGHPTG